MRILVFNCGSSSLKFAFFELGDDQSERVLLRGEFEEIGNPESSLTLEREGKKTKKPSVGTDYASATKAILAEVAKAIEGATPDAIAHRVVHGGPKISAPCLLDQSVLRELTDASIFAPLHNPPALETIRAVGEHLPEVPQIVATDTAFHQTMPPAARTYAIPWEMTERDGIRRFGFHGIGHAWMMQNYVELANKSLDRVNLITLQLGAGCSACAIRDGRSVDTSMGLTPLEGLMMATRSGDLDPAIFPYLAEREHLAPRDLEKQLNRRSGLLGVSGISGDMREVMQAETGNERAALAIEMFCDRVRKCIGAYLAVPGKVEAVIFGGGIGEHSAEIRARICRGLEHLGIVLDENCNRDLTSRGGRFSTFDSTIALWVIPLQEELYIARATTRLLRPIN